MSGFLEVTDMANHMIRYVPVPGFVFVVFTKIFRYNIYGLKIEK